MSTPVIPEPPVWSTDWSAEQWRVYALAARTIANDLGDSLQEAIEYLRSHQPTAAANRARQATAEQRASAALARGLSLAGTAVATGTSARQVARWRAKAKKD